ncbi:uncharacterized protein LOC134239725 [Saccostrea cucullata]|uniref:uncharacterized protein LOC134239725 n=1 Tax=Saccostrea cuccullata TaxID=36930 RepID=UPI002ED02DFE
MITSTTCLIRERLQKQKNKAVYIQNHYEPPSQKIQMNDVYNEISDERNFKDAQQITEQLHSSMTSNTMCGVYNHLRELPADDRENNYEHVHLSKTEDPSPGHCDGAIDGVPHPDKSSDRDEVVDDNDVLLESDRFKSNENYFVLEKQSFTRESLNQKGNNQ